jgi:hypothetical protein
MILIFFYFLMVQYRRGFVPQYFSFVKPAHLSGEKPPTITCSYPTDNDLKDKAIHAEEYLDEEILFEESFVYPQTPSELSMSDRYDPSGTVHVHAAKSSVHI